MLLSVSKVPKYIHQLGSWVKVHKVKGHRLSTLSGKGGLGRYKPIEGAVSSP